MSKLYVFGIGGTGSRVLRSLTMLLASGVECKSDTIVPIIIDPDDSSADKTRTIDLMNQYMAIRSKLEFNVNNTNRFFKTELIPVDGMTNFIFPLQNTRNCRFKDFIASSQLDKESMALVNMLFSEKNLNSDMKVGFKGNPNIGSVVLNQFSGSQHYKNFANGFEQGDRIFIISSIFGGTGASGFPLLLKTIRTDKSSQAWSIISKSKIGAVTVLPYFNVTEDDNSGVDSATFISKTKSALSYYEKNISENGSIDALYYLGDNVKALYDNNDGGSKQKNEAHFIELAAALAILNFAATPDDKLADMPLHYEYGLETTKDPKAQVTFQDFGKETRDLLCGPLTQFILMNKYLENSGEAQRKYQPWAIDNKLDKNFFNGDFFTEVTKLHDDYHVWLSEMSSNERSFKPFNEERTNPLFDIVNGKAPSKYYPHLFTRNYALVDSILNKRWPKWNKAATREQKFMELFFRATEDLVKHKYNV